MFHIDGEQLVKTSNGQPVPDDEPLFILRGRDQHAVAAMHWYIMTMKLHKCDAERIEAVRNAARRFEEFRASHPERMKQPGITRGA